MKHLKVFEESGNLDTWTKQLFDLQTNICFRIQRKMGSKKEDAMKIVKSAVDRVLTRNDVMFASPEGISISSIYFVILEGKWTLEEIWNLFDDEYKHGTNIDYIISLGPWEMRSLSSPKEELVMDMENLRHLYGSDTGMIWKGDIIE